MNRLEILLQMEAKQPDDAFVKYAIATEHISQGNDAAALPYFTLLVDKFPSYVPTYLHLGQLYERLEQLENAIETYKKGIDAAQQANDKKALGELNEALMMVED